MHVVITGANRGIGLEFCKQYSSSGATVTALCRQTSPELDQLGCRVVEGVEVTSPGPLSEVEPMELLILNAGIWRDESLEEMNFDTLMEQLEVNSVGPLRVVQSLQDRLKKGGKVALITSQMGSITDNTSGGRYGYRMSKAALNMAGASLAHDLRSREIAVALLHPGYVATDMTQYRGTIEPRESVTGLIGVLERLTLDNSGEFRNYRNELLAW